MNLIILGPPGSGKGTQAERLSRKFNLEHIDMGKTLREVAKQNTPLGNEIYSVQNITQSLVSDKVLKEVLELKLGSIPREQGLALDGAPRNLDQAEYVEELLKLSGRRIDKLVFVSISRKESERRVSLRRVCDACRLVFIIGKDVSSENNICPRCSGHISQRSDDTLEGIQKRLEVFEKETLPVIEYFQCKDLVVQVNGMQLEDEVFADILARVT